MSKLFENVKGNFFVSELNAANFDSTQNVFETKTSYASKGTSCVVSVMAPSQVMFNSPTRVLSSSQMTNTGHLMNPAKPSSDNITNKSEPVSTPTIPVPHGVTLIPSTPRLVTTAPPTSSDPFVGPPPNPTPSNPKKRISFDIKPEEQNESS